MSQILTFFLPGTTTPLGWMPAALALQLADYLTPTRQSASQPGFFGNLLGDAGNLSVEAWRRLRR